MQGWVSLHRRINDSETFEKLNILQKLMAIYIILNASHTDRIWYDKYKDIEVHLKRGELITSRNTIKNDWFHGDKEVTDAKIRTTFKKLERFGFLTIETTNNYTKLKVCNYNLYQGEQGRSNQVNDQEETKSKPSGNQEKTTINKVKNVKNDKNVKNKELVVQDDVPYEDVINYLNQKTGKTFRSKTKETRKNIRGRFNDGFTLEDFKSVIDKKTVDWKDNSKMNDYLRPQTLFIPANFESYLNQMEVEKKDDFEDLWRETVNEENRHVVTVKSNSKLLP